MSLVTAAATLVICSPALGEATDTAEAEDSRRYNGKIVFNRDGTLYTVEPDGSDLSPLSKDTKPTAWPLPAWAPDGTKLAFEDEGRIWLIDADGSNPRMLPTHGLVVDDASLAWSPNGERLAFQARPSAKEPPDVYTMDLDGSSMTDITNSPESYEETFDLSSDGSQLCFDRIDKAHVQGGIFVMEIDATDPPRLVGTRGSECAWSPDGTKIAYSSEAEQPDSASYLDVYVMNADGSGKTNLTNNPALDSSPVWSPDGTRIAFTSDRNGLPDIYTMDADGTDVAQVTTDSDSQDLDPDWQPLPGHTPPKDADGSDVAKGTKKPGVDDVDRDRPERTVIVKPGDSLWSISEQRLGPEASSQRLYDHTYQMYALNRKIVGADPDLIFAGQRLSLPPPR